MPRGVRERDEHGQPMGPDAVCPFHPASRRLAVETAPEGCATKSAFADWNQACPGEIMKVYQALPGSPALMHFHHLLRTPAGEAPRPTPTSPPGPLPASGRGR
jgi:hypothetical protein